MPKGEARLEKLERNLGHFCAEANHWLDKSNKLSKVAKTLSMIPPVSGDLPVSWAELEQTTTLQNLLKEDVWLTDDAIPDILQGVCAEDAEDGCDAENDPRARAVPGQLFLKHTYFKLQRVKDLQKKASQGHEKTSSKRNAVMTTQARVKESQQKHAQEAVEQWVREHKSEDGHILQDQRLARRNQINRKRKGVTKVKRIRSEEGLAEAGSC